MVEGLTILLCFQLAGEALVYALALPLPGPVAGMILLFVGLMLRGRLAVTLEQPATALLNALPLLFVPAGVGVMVHGRLIADRWPAIVAALAVSLVATLATSGLIMRWWGRDRRDDPHAG